MFAISTHLYLTEKFSTSGKKQFWHLSAEFSDNLESADLAFFDITS